MSGFSGPWDGPPRPPVHQPRPHPVHRLLARMMDTCAEATFEPVRGDDGEVIGYLARSRERAWPELIILPRAKEDT